MELTSRQHQVLNNLGVTVWQRRDKPVVAPASPESEQHAADAASVDVSGVLLLVMADTQLNDEKQRLLGAMLKSIALTWDQVSLIDRSAITHLSAQTLADKPALLMGDIKTSESLAQHSYSCPDLEQMLKQPELKASAWQTLKQLKTVF